MTAPTWGRDMRERTVDSPRREARFRLGWLVAAAVLAASRGAPAQAPFVTESPAQQGAIFQPVFADPKEPRFFAAYLLARSPRLAPRIGSVGFGQTIMLLGARDWQLAIAAGVFSQFNMQAATTDLMNTDYLVGLPLAYRSGSTAMRFQLYHQSSHLGDGYIVHTHAQRVTYSFEAAELLVSELVGNWRVYGGGEYLFTHAPDDLKSGIVHGGVDYRERQPLVRRPSRPAWLRLALERVAHGIHRAVALRSVLPRSRVVRRPRRRFRSVTTGGSREVRANPAALCGPNAGPDRSRGNRLSPLAQLPLLHHALQNERVHTHELLGGLARGEHAHRALARIRKRANHQQVPARHKLLPLPLPVLYSQAAQRRPP